MTKNVAILGTLLLVLFAAASGQKAKKESTIIGEVVDIKTYIAFGMKADNPDRKAAAEASMNAGNPLGILEKGTGKIYLVTSVQQNENANSRLRDYLGLRVYVKGVVYKKAGLQLMVMSDIGKTIK
jgi:hypothetical protein